MFVLGSRSDRELFEGGSAIGFGAIQDGMDEERSRGFLACIIHEGIADSVLGGTRLLNTAPAA